jgi:hypothetical protein
VEGDVETITDCLIGKSWGVVVCGCTLKVQYTWSRTSKPDKKKINAAAHRHGAQNARNHRIWREHPASDSGNPQVEKSIREMEADSG